jgi:threonine/homoserine/homoserine lactone efflux protein
VTAQLFIALFTFAGIAAWTPGPNNTLLLASGINYGFRRTVPMILGVAIGFPFMIGIVGLGLGKVFEFYPAIYTALKYMGSAYMLWLAYKILVSRPTDGGGKNSQPLTFAQAALFQWVNPKAWVIAATVNSAYTTAAAYYTGVSTIVGTFVFMGITSASAWALFGSSLRHLLDDPRHYRIINALLAAGLVFSIGMMLKH